MIQFEDLPDEFQSCVAEISDAMVHAVRAVEESPATTKNHYGNYMAIISGAGPSKTQQEFFAVALVHAGASPEGVEAALRLV